MSCTTSGARSRQISNQNTARAAPGPREGPSRDRTAVESHAPPAARLRHGTKRTHRRRSHAPRTTAKRTFALLSTFARGASEHAEVGEADVRIRSVRTRRIGTCGSRRSGRSHSKPSHEAHRNFKLFETESSPRTFPGRKSPDFNPSEVRTFRTDLRICATLRAVPVRLSLIHISEPTRHLRISYAVF